MSYAADAALVGQRADTEIDALTTRALTADAHIAALTTENARLEADNARLHALVDAGTVTPPPPTSTTKYGSCVGPTVASVDALFGGIKVLRCFDGGKGPGMWTRDGASQVGADVAVSTSFKGSPASIMAGSNDAAWQAFWRSVPKRTGAVYWTFYHEPEDNVERGEFTAKQWRDAFAYLIQLQNKTTGITQPSTPLPILMSWTLVAASGRNMADYLVPGAKDIGFDTYGKSEAVLAVAYAKAHGLTLHIPELGWDARKTTLTDDQVKTLIDEYAVILDGVAGTVSWFNNTGTLGDNRLDGKPKSAAAWKALCDK